MILEPGNVFAYQDSGMKIAPKKSVTRTAVDMDLVITDVACVIKVGSVLFVTFKLYLVPMTVTLISNRESVIS